MKPYALVLVPWLAWTLGMATAGVFALVWRRTRVPARSTAGTATDAVARVVSHRHRDDGDPICWGPTTSRSPRCGRSGWRPGRPRRSLALPRRSSPSRPGGVLMSRRRHVTEPNYLEARILLVLVPLLSPQGWDYMLVIALPAYVLLVDRWRDLSLVWRGVALTASSSRASRFSICLAARSIFGHGAWRRQRRRRAARRVPGPAALAGDRVSAAPARSVLVATSAASDRPVLCVVVAATSSSPRASARR